MKIKLNKVYIILISSMVMSSMNNAMYLNMDSKTWLEILHANGIPSPKAEQCAQLLPKFLDKHPQSALELSALQSKPHELQFAVLHELCDKLMQAKDEL